MTSKWRKRDFDSPWVTEYPAGPELERLANRKVYVTSPGYDNIGEILSSMGVEYRAFSGKFDCSLLFINCGTNDHVDTMDLVEFVHNGGCLYASDHASKVLEKAFPDLFSFVGNVGVREAMTTEVLDPELRDVLGKSAVVEFDMGSWSVLGSCVGEVLLRESMASGGAGRPIMAYVEFGRGSIFYTCFHNKSQTSDDERRLLKLLVTKQFSTISGTSVEQTGKSLGLAIR